MLKLQIFRTCLSKVLILCVFFEWNLSTPSEIILRLKFKYKTKSIFINEAPGVCYSALLHHLFHFSNSWCASKLRYCQLLKSHCSSMSVLPRQPIESNKRRAFLLYHFLPVLMLVQVIGMMGHWQMQSSTHPVAQEDQELVICMNPFFAVNNIWSLSCACSPASQARQLWNLKISIHNTIINTAGKNSTFWHKILNLYKTINITRL